MSWRQSGKLDKRRFTDSGAGENVIPVKEGGRVDFLKFTCLKPKEKAKLTVLAR